MKNFRFLIFLLTVWLIIFFNVKHLFNLFENNIVFYIAVLIFSVLIILIPGSHKVSGWLIILLPTLLFLVANIWSGGYESIIEITMTVSEALTIIVTLLLSYWVNLLFRKYEKNIFQTSSILPEKILSKEPNGLGYIYREVRRARNHNNPMALLAITIDESSTPINQNDEYKISKLEKNKENTLIRIGNILCNELEECAIIVQGDDHFLVALPETKPEEIPFIAERLRKQCKKQLEVDLSVGSASLPKDGYTFAGLYEKATSDMKTDIATNFFSEAKRSHAKKAIISGK